MGDVVRQDLMYIWATGRCEMTNGLADDVVRDLDDVRRACEIPRS
jgi:hypothetical protein